MNRIRRMVVTQQHHDWYLAEAYLRLDRPDSAVAAFERVLDPTGGDWARHYEHGVFFPYAHRRLALLYEQLGRPDRAEDHWDIVLQTVTEPDPEIRWMRRGSVSRSWGGGDDRLTSNDQRDRGRSGDAPASIT